MTMIAKPAALAAAALHYIDTTARKAALECTRNAELEALGLSIARCSTEDDIDAYTEAEMAIEDRLGYTAAWDAHFKAEGDLVELGLAWIASDDFRASVADVDGIPAATVANTLAELSKRADQSRTNVVWRAKFAAVLLKA